MKLAFVFFAMVLTGCAGRFDAVPAHAFPHHVSADEAETLYKSHALNCDGGECTRADGTRPVRAYSENGYADAEDVLKSHRRAKLVGGLVPGATGAGAILVGIAFMGMASQQEKQAADIAGFGVDTSNNLEKAEDYRTVSMGMFVAGGALAITGAIIGVALPSGEEEFEETYNRALREDLERRRHATDPVGMVILPARR